jgi:hypothetical protein
MISFMTNKQDAARFVEDILRFSGIDYQSITITSPAKSGDCCVSIVTDISSEDTVRRLGRIYLDELMST